MASERGRGLAARASFNIGAVPAVRNAAVLCAFLDWTAHIGALQESEFEVKGAGAKDVKETCESQWWQQLATHVGSDYDVLSVLSMWEIRRSAMHLAVSTLDPCGSSAGVPALAPAPSYPVWSLVLRRRFACGLESHAARALVYEAWCTLHVAASQARCSCAQEACSIRHERAVIVRGNRCVQAPDTVPSLGPIVLAFRRYSRIPAAPSLARSTPPIPYNAIVCFNRS